LIILVITTTTTVDIFDWSKKTLTTILLWSTVLDLAIVHTSAAGIIKWWSAFSIPRTRNLLFKIIINGELNRYTLVHVLVFDFVFALPDRPIPSRNFPDSQCRDAYRRWSYIRLVVYIINRAIKYQLTLRCRQGTYMWRLGWLFCWRPRRKRCGRCTSTCRSPSRACPAMPPGTKATRPATGPCGRWWPRPRDGRPGTTGLPVADDRRTCSWAWPVRGVRPTCRWDVRRSAGPVRTGRLWTNEGHRWKFL